MHKPVFHSDVTILPGLLFPVVLAAGTQTGVHLNVAPINWALVPSVLVPILIFAIRAINLTIATVRTLSVANGRRIMAWGLGFCQSLLFVTVIAGVLNSLDNPWNLVAYAAGFATGIVLGIIVESKLAPGHSLLRIISSNRGDAIIENLYSNNHGATAAAGRGANGMVTAIFCCVPRCELKQIQAQILAADPDAFITVEQIRQLHGGWHT